MDKLKVFLKTFVIIFLLAGGIAFLISICFVAFGHFTVMWALGVAIGTGIGNGLVSGLFKAFDS